MLTNANVWDAIRSAYPDFASHTSSSTYVKFDEKGFSALKKTDKLALDQFFNLPIRMALLDIETSQAKDTLEEKGFGENYNVPFGEIIQRLVIDYVKPISAGYRNNKVGPEASPAVNRPMVVKDRYFVQNFDYASLISVPDDFTRKVIFTSEYGMSEFVAGAMSALQTGYTVQKFENSLEAISKGLLNNTVYPLKETQKWEVTFAGAEPTDAELAKLLLAFTNAKSALDLAPITSAYNAYGFASTQPMDRLKVLIRPGYKNAIENINALNRPGLSLPVDLIEVPNFGGLEHYTDDTVPVTLYPHYDYAGAEDGWTKTAPAADTVYGVDAVDEREKYTGTVVTKDPNENVIAILADKGILFSAQQNPYEVEPFRNPRTRKTHYWASCPGNTIAIDPVKNAIVFYKSTTSSKNAASKVKAKV